MGPNPCRSLSQAPRCDLRRFRMGARSQTALRAEEKTSPKVSTMKDPIMKINPMQRLLILGGLAAAVSGCATSPMSKDIRTEAKATRHVSFASISRNPSAYKGEEVIWGGEIVKVLNEPNASKIYLSEIPLDRSGDPVYPAKTPGTFIARISGTADPELYKPGRVI